MSQLMFVFKTFIFTFLLLVAMQYRWEGSTLESHAQRWLHTSNLGVYIQQTAEGGAQLARDGYNKLNLWVNSVGKNSNSRK